MKMLIFGATGTIGQGLVKQGLEQGHTVTAFVRNPAKIGIEHENLQTVQGDVMNAEAVEKAVQLGHDAVIYAVGAGTKGDIRSTGTRRVIEAMEKAGIKRFICLSSLGVGDSRGNLNFFWRFLMFGIVLRKAMADHEKQEEFIKQSRLDWTIVRPAAFTDGERTGKYQCGFAADDKTTKLKISRADVADFMLKQLSDNTYLRKTPGLSY